MDSKRYETRIRTELEALFENPPLGIRCYQKFSDPLILEATIEGPTGTPYCGGIFHLGIRVQNGYPFEPPIVRFLTPIFHPNIDGEGIISSDILQGPPNGSWNCSLSIIDVLIHVQQLLATPNTNDTSDMIKMSAYKNNRRLFDHLAQEKTVMFAQSHIVHQTQPQTQSVISSSVNAGASTSFASQPQERNVMPTMDIEGASTSFASQPQERNVMSTMDIEDPSLYDIHHASPSIPYNRLRPDVDIFLQEGVKRGAADSSSDEEKPSKKQRRS